MGRMWNTLLLYKWKPIFAWLPIETLIRERQDAYYAALGQAENQIPSFFRQIGNQLDIADRQSKLELVFQPGFLQHVRHMEFDR